MKRVSKRVLLLGVLLALGGCKKASDEHAQPEAPKAEAPESGVVLTADEVKKLGVTTSELSATKHATEVSGYAQILARDSIAQTLAEIKTAEAMQRQSHAALERQQKLAGTAGALPADSLEAAERQAAVDDAALRLAQQKLSSAFGRDAPWGNKGDLGELPALASGDAKLAKVIFPLGSLHGQHPTQLRFSRLDAISDVKRIESHRVWTAPADAAIPGQSLYAILVKSDFNEGERLQAFAQSGEEEDGVMVPTSAVLLNNGQYWCYLEHEAGHFTRTAIDASAPSGDGYFVRGPLKAGDHVVVSAAAELLAHELNPGSEAEAD